MLAHVGVPGNECGVIVDGLNAIHRKSTRYVGGRWREKTCT
jgi:hypothetical protein